MTALEVPWAVGGQIPPPEEVPAAHEIDIDRPTGQLPDEFWEARPYLAHIRRAAWSKGCAAETVLSACFARWGVVNNHCLQLPAHVGHPVGLSLIVSMVGWPGTGKGTAARLARDLIPRGDILQPELDGIPPGSGEGLPEILMAKVKEFDPIVDATVNIRKQVFHNCYVYFDEGEVLTQQMDPRSKSRLPSALKSIFMSAEIGQANANDDRRRIIPAGSYVFGVLIGIQPAKAGPLFTDVSGGLTQRILWANAGTPVPPPDQWPDWPGPLDLKPLDLARFDAHKELDEGYIRWRYTVPTEIADEIKWAQWNRNQGRNEELDEHELLIRLKLAGILAGMDSRLAITADDWQLAGQVVAASVETRTWVTDELGRLRREDLDRRIRTAGAVEVGKAAALERDKTSRCARKITDKVWAEPDRWTRSDLRRALPHWRDWFNAGLDDAVAQGWVVVDPQPGQGDDKKVLRPGRNKP